MADRRISVRDRVGVIADIERAAFYVNAIAAWLGEQGLETEADMVDASAKGLLATAGCWSGHCALSSLQSAGQTLHASSNSVLGRRISAGQRPGSGPGVRCASDS